MSKVVYNSREYVRFWFQKANVSVRDATSRVSCFATVYLDYVGLYNQHVLECLTNGSKPRKPLQERELRFAFDEYVELVSFGLLREATKGLEFNGGTLEPLKTWVSAVTGIADEREIGIMAHWMWQIKRKAIGKPVVHQVMPIIFGRQGGGKTVALEQLISPIKDFRLNLQMTSLGDERMYKGFAANLVILFDELQNIERTNLNTLKNQITTNTNTYRPLHTNLIVNIPMNCSFIGASNKPINENFSDSTGMRRFYQLNALQKLDWTTINGTDYKALWQCIDETLDHGYLTGKILEEVQNQQTNLVNKDEFTTFLEECGLVPEPGAPTKKVSASAAYRAFQEWVAKNGARGYSSVYYNARLKNLGLKYQVENNGRKAYYHVAADANIEPEAVVLTVVKK